MSAAESNRDERLLTLVPQADDYLATATSGWPEPARRLYCWLYESGESGYVVAPPQQQLARCSADWAMPSSAATWLTGFSRSRASSTARRRNSSGYGRGIQDSFPGDNVASG